MKKYIMLTVMAVIVALPLVAFLAVGSVEAQTQALKTAPNVDFIVSCSGVVAQDGLPSCNWCSLVKMIGNMVQYSIYLAVMLSSLMFAYAGFLFLTNNGQHAQITRAWAIFKRALLGTIAILAAWLIVNAIMTRLASGLDLGDNWYSITGCEGNSVPGLTDQEYSRRINDKTGNEEVYTNQLYNDQQAQQGYDDITGGVIEPSQTQGTTNVFIDPGRF